MRQQTFQKALSRLTDTGFRLFFVTGLVFAVLTGLYNIWLCMAELVILLVLYLYFQSGAIRRKQEAMDYLDHLASGVDNASRRTMLSSPMPIAIFRPDTDDIIWSNERFLHLTGDPDHLFETKLSALKEALKSGSIDDIKAKQDDLQKAFYAISEKVYQQAAQQQGQQPGADAQQGPTGNAGSAPKDDGAVDADFHEV
mgnify:CR=1 FL=1